MLSAFRNFGLENMYGNSYSKIKKMSALVSDQDSAVRFVSNWQSFVHVRSNEINLIGEIVSHLPIKCKAMACAHWPGSPLISSIHYC